MELEGLDLAVYALALPLVIGLVQLLKDAILPPRWAGLAAVLIGVAAGIVIQLAGVGSGSLIVAALTGAIAGLSAAGVWSGARAAGQR